MEFHCFFEQSGVFKNEFKKLGFKAYDYDILNEFNETDFVIDLFNEICLAYDGMPSIFDNISAADYIIAFFPCVRFENQIMLWFRGQNYAQRSWSMEQKMEYDMKLLSELKEMYDLVNKLFIVCIRKNLKLIMENPFSEEHFLRRYWCCAPDVVDMDRRESGDYFKKPTQFWFLNCKPANNFVFEPITYNALNMRDSVCCVSSKDIPGVCTPRKSIRSLIHKDYANRFIKQYIICMP